MPHNVSVPHTGLLLWDASVEKFHYINSMWSDTVVMVYWKESYKLFVSTVMWNGTDKENIFVVPCLVHLIKTREVAAAQIPFEKVMPQWRYAYPLNEVNTES